MSTLKRVLGCVGLCRVGFANPTQAHGMNGGALRVLCGVCWVWHRARACAAVSLVPSDGEAKILYARTEKPNKPNTLNTDASKALIYMGFNCVGFVLGWGFCVGLGSAGEKSHD
ncbi:hypothetical protein [Stutzerimonas stutzeri]|uniref:hypothetical protein n=1 Tax=Stutzerimonas stutzeri TaxID=316 RepID=UPI00210E6C83|nr:hypothetical protein [Stutzerimonas stutzeri]MCQ4257459.1 hypothetical protein [Stutzerimonas stutzeri]